MINDAAACGTTLDHAIVAVGYGVDTSVSPNLQYFIVRNSWGTTWGLSGFVYIAYSPTGTAPGMCGMNEQVYYPNAHKV